MFGYDFYFYSYYLEFNAKISVSIYQLFLFQTSI